MGVVCDSYCLDCIYYEKQAKNCGYVIIVDKLRGCDPGEGCTRRVLASEKLHKIRRDVIANKTTPRPSKIPQELHELRMDYYLQFKTDEEIARLTGCSKSEIFDWRKRNDLEPVARLRRRFHRK